VQNSGQEQQVKTNLHIFYDMYFIEPTVSEADFTSTSAVCYETEQYPKKLEPGTALSGVTEV
jgi:hypothetical protein